MGSWVFINNPTGYLEMPPREYNPLKGVIIPESAVTRTHTRGTEGSDHVHETLTIAALLPAVTLANHPRAACCE